MNRAEQTERFVMDCSCTERVYGRSKPFDDGHAAHEEAMGSLMSLPVNTGLDKKTSAEHEQTFLYRLLLLKQMLRQSLETVVLSSHEAHEDRGLSAWSCLLSIPNKTTTTDIKL